MPASQEQKRKVLYEGAKKIKVVLTEVLLTDCEDCTG